MLISSYLREGHLIYKSIPKTIIFLSKNIYSMIRIKLFRDNQLVSNICSFIMKNKIFSLLFIINIFIRILFFKPFLYSWDSGEYAWAVSSYHHTHYPYPIYIMLGVVGSQFLIPEILLTLFSFLSGILILFPVYKITSYFTNKETGLISVLKFAYIPVVLAFSSFQEIYALQAFVAILSISLLLKKRGLLPSAFLFGISIGIHKSTLILIPAVLFLMIKEKYGLKKMLVWFCLMLIIGILGFIWTFSTMDDKVYALDYVLYAPSAVYKFTVPWLLNSLYSLFNSLIDSFTLFLLVLSLLGFISLLLRKKYNILTFFLLFAGPYIIYDIGNRSLSDWGLFMPLIAPALVILSSFFIYEMGLLFKHKQLFISLSILLFIVFVLNSILLSPSLNWLISFKGEGYDSFVWVSQITPNNSYIVTYGSPWIVTYYTERLWILGMDWYYIDEGEWTTTNIVRPLNNATLFSLIENGTEVFSFLSSVEEQKLNSSMFLVSPYARYKTNTLYKISLRDSRLG